MDENDEMLDSWPGRLAASLRRLRCPRPSEVAAFVDGVLDPARERRLRTHLAACDDCSLAVTELRHLSRESLPDVPSVLLREARQLNVGYESASRLVPHGRLVAAAALACVATLVGVWLGGRAGKESLAGTSAMRTVRGQLPEDRGPALVSPERDAVLNGAEVRVEWRSVPDAIAYEIVLVDAEGGLIESLVPNGSLSAAPRSSLPPGTYFVSVTATLRDGRSAKSGFSRFTIRPGR